PEGRTESRRGSTGPVVAGRGRRGRKETGHSRFPFGTLNVPFVSSLPDEIPQLLDAKDRLPAVQHRMAVGTYWQQVRERIDGVRPAGLGQRADVADVDVPLGHRPVHRAEIEP